MLTNFVRLKQQIALTHCHQYMQKYINSQNELDRSDDAIV